jgi:molybdate transport system ATP-binding protein
MTGEPDIDAAFAGTLGAFTLDAAFTAPARGITGLFGPSGCGKTTVLRCIAGLTRVAIGRCIVDGQTWQDDKTFWPTYRRPVGYVFQEASLFPHLSVKKNLAYGAKRAGSAGGSQVIGFDEVTELLGLGRLLDRSTHNLSGGERQRVAIGRALLSQPRLLLMDEPLAALDRITKDEILPFLERLHDTLSVPVIYVSHDMSEVERLADTLVLMEAGRVIASGPLAALQSDPALPLVKARDAAVSLDAVVESYDPAYGLLNLSVAGGRLVLPGHAATAGERRRVRIVAGDVSLALEPPRSSTILNTFPVRILSRTPVGEHEMIVLLGLGSAGEGAHILARVTRRSWDQLSLSEGQSLHAQVKSVALARGHAPPATETTV